MSKAIILISLTEQGQALAEKLHQTIALPSQLAHKPTPFTEAVQTWFQQSHPIIFIGAMGIIIRTLAPVLTHKNIDPPVIVMDDRGQFVIPILSGHEGGANALADDIAQLLTAHCVITTAGHYTQPVYTIGMGCERHCDSEHLKQLVTECLAQANLSIEQIAQLASLDVKADEAGLLTLSEQLNWPFHTHTTERLRQVEHQLSERSEIVFNAVGVYGVAEAAALCSANDLTQQPAELVLTKQKTTRATCAIARSYPISHPQQRTAT